MMALEQFIALLDRIPWFKRLGQPSTKDIEVFRIYSWKTWPGPENPGAEIQSANYQRWRDELFGAETLPSDDPVMILWDQIQTKVMALAKLNVPYHDEQDAWYGPNAAVWSAGWVAALVGCALLKKRYKIQTPASQWTLEYEWEWFAEGHWPCCYYWAWGYTERAAIDRTGGARRIVVF